MDGEKVRRERVIGTRVRGQVREDGRGAGVPQEREHIWSTGIISDRWWRRRERKSDKRDKEMI